MNELYKRNINIKLFLLRLISLTLLILLITSAAKGFYDYAILFLIILLPTFFLTLTQVIIYNDRVIITKVFAIGLKINVYEVTLKNILFMTKFEEEINHSSYPGGSVHLKVIMTRFIYKDDKDTEISLDVKLNVKEYNIAWTTLNGQSTRH